MYKRSKSLWCVNFCSQWSNWSSHRTVHEFSPRVEWFTNWRTVSWFVSKSSGYLDCGWLLCDVYRMAEAHSAVAFSFNVTTDGVNVQFNHEALWAVWRSGVRSWKKKTGRLKVCGCWELWNGTGPMLYWPQYYYYYYYYYYVIINDIIINYWRHQLPILIWKTRPMPCHFFEVVCLSV